MYKWDESKLHSRQYDISESTPHWHHWDNTSNQRSFMEDLAKRLNINDQEGWYSISSKSVQEHGGLGLLKKYNHSISNIMEGVFPEYQK